MNMLLFIMTTVSLILHIPDKGNRKGFLLFFGFCLFYYFGLTQGWIRTEGGY